MSESDASDVSTEVAALLALRPKISLAECASLRRYAWRRSQFPHPDDRLSETAITWRKLFFRFDHELEVGFGPEKKQRLDSIEKTAIDLELAERVMQYRIKSGPQESSHLGPILGILAFCAGSAAGWVVFHGFIVAGILGVLASGMVTLCSATVLQDTWSSTFSAAWMQRLGRLLRWQSLRAAGIRLINVNVLRMDEYNKTGDPSRIADGIRAADDLLTKQEGIIRGALEFLEGNVYQTHVRDAESRLVNVEMSPGQRLSEATAVVDAVERGRSVIFSDLDRVTDELDVELLEVERQLGGIPKSTRRHRAEAWLSCARKEYLNGRLATNILRNRFEFDCSIASAVVSTSGSLDVTFEGNEFAQKAASSFWLPDFQRERQSLSAERSRVQTELFGVLA